jgi:hypothetical protein
MLRKKLHKPGDVQVAAADDGAWVAGTAGERPGWQNPVLRKDIWPDMGLPQYLA